MITLYYTSSIQGTLLYADLDGCICSDVVMYEGMFLHEAFRESMHALKPNV